MSCFVCSKKKEEYDVWNNKITISATYDSEFQKNKHIVNMSEKSAICHDCVQKIEKETDLKRK